MLDEKLAKDIITKALDFSVLILEARESAKKNFRDEESTNDNSLRLLIDGMLARTALFMTKKVEGANEKISYQIGISASFVRTHFVIMDLILDGSYVEADILIRKQVESLARMIELDKFSVSNLKEKTPNIGHLRKWGLGRMYGLLNKTVHFSVPEISELLGMHQEGDRVGFSIVPMYSEQAHSCFARSVATAIPFFQWTMEKCGEWYDGFDKTEMETALVHIFALAVEANIFQFEK